MTDNLSQLEMLQAEIRLLELRVASSKLNKKDNQPRMTLRQVHFAEPRGISIVITK